MANRPDTALSLIATERKLEKNIRVNYPNVSLCLQVRPAYAANTPIIYEGTGAVRDILVMVPLLTVRFATGNLSLSNGGEMTTLADL